MEFIFVIINVLCGYLSIKLANARGFYAAAWFLAGAFIGIPLVILLWLNKIFKFSETIRESDRAKRQIEAARFEAARIQREKEEESQYLARKARSDEFRYFIERKIEEKKYAIVSERKKLISRDAYGNEQLKSWIGSPLLDPAMIKLQFFVGNDEWFEKGIPYFWYKVLLPSLSNHAGAADQAEAFFAEWDNYLLVYPTCIDQTEGGSFKRSLGTQDWYSFVATEVENACLEVIGNKEEQSVDTLSGVDYEEYCAKTLEDAGWEVETTVATGDQGVDLIAIIDDIRVCIQCKRYSKPVGNKAVQEIAAGVTHWNGTHAVVVSNAGFTKAAQKLAESTGVFLVSDLELENLENLLYQA